jgi:hypothetical protein
MCLNALASSCFSFSREPERDGKGLMTMKRMEHDSAARRRGELTRDRGSRRVSVAIDARRRLNSGRAAGLRTRAGPHGPRDPRYAYLAHSHD